MTFDLLFTGAAILFLAGLGTISLALANQPVKSPLVLLKSWLIEPPLPNTITVSKSENRRLSQRGAYIYQQIKKACLGLDLVGKRLMQNGKTQYTYPTFAQCQIVVSQEAYYFPILKLPPRITWRQFANGKLTKELQRALHVEVELVEVDDKDDVNHLIVYDKGRMNERLPKVTRYADMLPLPNGLKLPVGVDAHGHKHYHLLASKGAPHILVGGSTGSGKSVLINGWLTALVTHHSADQIQLYLIDLKQVEFAVYQHVPHVKEIATEGQDALLLLDKLLAEVKSRYAQVSAEFKTGIPDGDVADKILKKQPRLVLVIDELAELTLTYPEAVNTLIRLAQIARAAKVNIIAATQRPDVKVCPGNLKTNFDNRLALALPTQTDSRVILDAGGAELLVPPGQALWRSGQKTTALVVPLLTDEERNARLRRLLEQNAPEQPDTQKQNAAELIEHIARRLEVAGKRATVLAVYTEAKSQGITRKVVMQILRDRRVPPE